jgi:lipoyl(octanoyl) transferase
LLFCEHPHVYTLGRNGKESHLLLDEAGLAEKDATFFKINRGGDITYHGYGQVVGYPILDMDEFFTDIARYVRILEETVIRMLTAYGIEGTRIKGLSGVWIEAETERARKICAVGVHLSRWTTMHGFALNVNTDLTYFEYIVPCGIDDKAVTSMQKELGRAVDMEAVKAALKQHFAELMGAHYSPDQSK